MLTWVREQQPWESLSADWGSTREWSNDNLLVIICLCSVDVLILGLSDHYWPIQILNFFGGERFSASDTVRVTPSFASFA